mmetsp:Transcript_17621/g.20181  ORF Transcript_17621/g.20181 Transcript_17621/m.20181 type:complete len:437 (+) Transcript_17621:644-1954(+)
MFSLGFVYIQFAIHIIKTTSNQDLYDNSNFNGIQMREENQQRQQRQVRVGNPFDNDAYTSKSNYYEWKKYAVHLAGMAPADIVVVLKKEDPFGVRTFEAQLLKTESEKGRFLSLEELQYIFPCPTSGDGNNGRDNNSATAERITLPDQRDHGKAEAFRNGVVPYFLFFQHLRKAGGTNFCSLAESNLKKNELPKYYCMPDYHWDMKNRGAGYLTRYDNKNIVQNMKEKGHKIAGNEWDPFDSDRFFDLPATFATSFRRPLDRALSQFRFECMEERGCKTKNVTKWWTKRKDLTNVYTWTFANEGVRRVSIGNSPQDAYRRQELIGKALDAVAKFNLVMVMEWLAYAPTHVTQVLGFKDTKSLTERVRPHIGQHKREDGQEHNNMGAAGIAKASWTPEDYLPPALYDKMSHDLALDEILTDAARRMFLERIVCNDVS